MAEVEVTGTDTVEVAVGDVIVIRLPENTATGYRWSVGELGDGLEPAGEELEPPGARAGAGAAGERVIRVRAAAPGAAVVVLVNGREREPSPVEQRRVRVTVRT